MAILRCTLLIGLVWTALVAAGWWQTNQRRESQVRSYAVAQARVYARTDLALHTAGLDSGQKGGYGSIRVDWKGREGTPGSTAPDHWENQALDKLSRGADEVFAVDHRSGDRHLRWMGPVHGAAACVRCHTEIDPRSGALRGGISVSLPLDPLLAVSKSAWKKQAVAHLVAWLVGFGVIVFSFFVLSRGLVERDRVTRDLEAALEATEAIVQSVPFGMVIVGRDKIVRQVNRFAESILGKNADEIVGRVCNETFCPALTESCPILDLGQKLDNAERTVLDPDGKPIPVYKSVLPIRWQGEDVLLEAFIDISEHSKVLADQQALLKEEQRLNRLATGRELRMVQLKQEVNALLEEVGRPIRYQSTEQRLVERGTDTRSPDDADSIEVTS